MGRPGNCHSPVIAVENVDVSPFFLMSLLMVSMYLNFGLPLGLTPSTSMSSTVSQRSRFCIRCVPIASMQIQCKLLFEDPPGGRLYGTLMNERLRPTLYKKITNIYLYLRITQILYLQIIIIYMIL